MSGAVAACAAANATIKLNLTATASPSAQVDTNPVTLSVSASNAVGALTAHWTNIGALATTITSPNATSTLASGVDGSHQVQVDVVDAAGNRGSATVSFTFFAVSIQ